MNIRVVGDVAALAGAVDTHRLLTEAIAESSRAAMTALPSSLGLISESTLASIDAAMPRIDMKVVKLIESSFAQAAVAMRAVPQMTEWADAWRASPVVQQIAESHQGMAAQHAVLGRAFERHIAVSNRMQELVNSQDWSPVAGIAEAARRATEQLMPRGVLAGVVGRDALRDAAALLESVFADFDVDSYAAGSADAEPSIDLRDDAVQCSRYAPARRLIDEPWLVANYFALTCAALAVTTLLVGEDQDLAVFWGLMATIAVILGQTMKDQRNGK